MYSLTKSLWLFYEAGTIIIPYLQMIKLRHQGVKIICPRHASNRLGCSCLGTLILELGH